MRQPAAKHHAASPVMCVWEGGGTQAALRILRYPEGTVRSSCCRQQVKKKKATIKATEAGNIILVSCLHQTRSEHTTGQKWYMKYNYVNVNAVEGY